MCGALEVHVVVVDAFGAGTIAARGGADGVGEADVFVRIRAIAIRKRPVGEARVVGDGTGADRPEEVVPCNAAGGLGAAGGEAVEGAGVGGVGGVGVGCDGLAVSVAAGWGVGCERCGSGMGKGG